MTYHFHGMDDLLRQAFTRFAEAGVEQLREALTAANDRDQAGAAVVDLIHGDAFGVDSTRDLVLLSELYTLAARKPVFRGITRAWVIGLQSMKTTDDEVEVGGPGPEAAHVVHGFGLLNASRGTTHRQTPGGKSTKQFDVATYLMLHGAAVISLSSPSATGRDHCGQSPAVRSK